MSKINIKYASDELTEALRKGTNNATKLLQNNPTDNSWVYDYVSEEAFVRKKYTIEDFELKKPKNEKDYDTIFEDAIILYEHLNHLPGYILSDERFWLWLMLEKFYAITLALMPIESVSTFKDHWLFTQGIRRGIFFGVLSRLYFRVMLSVDSENTEDPYYYTRFAFENQYRIRELTWRTFSSEHHIILGALKGIKEFLDNNKGIEENNKAYTKLAKDISQLGSVKLLDAMTEEYIKEQVVKLLEQYYDNKIGELD